MARWGAMGNVIEGNQILAVGGGTWDKAAAMYVLDDGANTWKFNTFSSIALSTGQYAYGTGLLMANHGESSNLGGSVPGNDVINDNTFASNNRILSLYDPSVGGGVQGVPLYDDTLEFLDPSTALANFWAAALAKNQQLARSLTAAQQATINSIMAQIPTANPGDQATIYAGNFDATITLLASTLLNGASLTPTGVEMVDDDWIGESGGAPMLIGVGSSNTVQFYLVPVGEAMPYDQTVGEESA